MFYLKNNYFKYKQAFEINNVAYFELHYGPRPTKIFGSSMEQYWIVLMFDSLDYFNVRFYQVFKWSLISNRTVPTQTFCVKNNYLLSIQTGLWN